MALTVGKRWYKKPTEVPPHDQALPGALRRLRAALNKAKATLLAGINAGFYLEQSLDRWLQSAIIEYTRGQPPADLSDRAPVDGPITDGGSGADEKVFHEPTPGAD